MRVIPLSARRARGDKVMRLFPVPVIEMAFLSERWVILRLWHCKSIFVRALTLQALFFNFLSFRQQLRAERIVITFTSLQRGGLILTRERTSNFLRSRGQLVLYSLSDSRLHLELKRVSLHLFLFGAGWLMRQDKIWLHWIQKRKYESCMYYKTRSMLMYLLPLRSTFACQWKLIDQ